MIKLNTIAGLEHVRDYYFIENDVIYSTFYGDIRIKAQRDKKGYLYVNLMTDKSLNSVDFRVNRLVAMAYIPRIIGCNIVHHKNEDKKNNSIANLEWTTNRRNTMFSSKSADLFIRQATIFDLNDYLTDEKDENIYINADVFINLKNTKNKNIEITDNTEYEQLAMFN